MNRTSVSCRHYDRHQSAYLDGQLPAAVRQEIEAHLDLCPRCSQHARGLRDVRAAVRRLPRVPAPESLAMQLRVIASRELARSRAGVTAWSEWRQRCRLWIENMMRPLALPAAGGVLSALLLFGMISPQLAARGAGENTVIDVPTAIFRDPSLTSTPLMGYELENLEIELTIDDEGRLLDYAIPQNHDAKIRWTRDVQRSIEQSLLLSRFEPARAFGQATKGKIRLRFRSSSIDVKG